jgi:hypothetical protein
MVDFLARTSDKWSYLAGVAWILGFAALFIFFAVGGVFGTINDAISIFQFLFLIPVALTLHRILALHAPTVSGVTAALGIGAMLAIAFLQLLLVLGTVQFEQTMRPILLLGAIVGLWWLATSSLGLARGTLPVGPAWAGVVAGAAIIVTAIGFVLGGQQHPLSVAGFVVGAVAVPVWAFWLGKVLASGTSGG